MRANPTLDHLVGSFLMAPCFKQQSKKTFLQRSGLYANRVRNDSLLKLDNWTTLICHHLGQGFLRNLF